MKSGTEEREVNRRVFFCFLCAPAQELSVSPDSALMRYVKIHFARQTQEVKQRVKTQAVEHSSDAIGTGNDIFTV